MTGNKCHGNKIVSQHVCAHPPIQPLSHTLSCLVQQVVNIFKFANTSCLGLLGLLYARAHASSQISIMCRHSSSRKQIGGCLHASLLIGAAGSTACRAATLLRYCKSISQILRQATAFAPCCCKQQREILTAPKSTLLTFQCYGQQTG